MGAKSSSEFGDIYIKIDKFSYFPGEKLDGTVHLFLQKDFPGNELIFSFKGKENTLWSEGSSLYRGTIYQISYKETLYKANSKTFPKGQYSFPFSLKLKEILAATFDIDYQEVTASISYRIKCQIKCINKKFKPLRTYKTIKIKQSRNDILAISKKDINLYIHLCCCYSPGFTNIKTNINKTYFTKGETAIIDCFINNSHSNLKLISIEASFIGKLYVTSKNSWNTSREYFINSQKKTIILPAKFNSPGQIQFEVPITSPSKFLYTSTNGIFVKNHYFIRLSPNYNNIIPRLICCENQVETEILIYDPNDENLQEIEAPNNWNPVVFEEKNFDLQNAEIYQGNNNKVMPFLNQYMPANINLINNKI